MSSRFTIVPQPVILAEGGDPVIKPFGEAAINIVMRSVTPFSRLLLASQKNHSRPIYRCLPNLSSSPAGGKNRRERHESTGRERSEPEGRVSGMIRANPEWRSRRDALIH
ncbi:hypothetical protein [Candidatus Spongiihabitans sp.]|uniref:hypothetical protein n=1 Tax=Candidatus Spongiihabitans sp. TaxID=3101308 RepID=UPI003C7A9358